MPLSLTASNAPAPPRRAKAAAPIFIISEILRRGRKCCGKSETCYRPALAIGRKAFERNREPRDLTAVPGLDDTTCARRTIDPRPIRSALCQQRPLRASSRPLAPKPRPSSTIPPFPEPGRSASGAAGGAIPRTRGARRPCAGRPVAGRRNDALAHADAAGLCGHRQQRACRLHRGQGAGQGLRPAQIRRPARQGAMGQAQVPAEPRLYRRQRVQPLAQRRT